MILVTNKETDLPAYIWVKEIQRMETHGGSSPFTRVYLKNEKENHDYFLDVRDKKHEIEKKIRFERLIPGHESEEIQDD